MTVYLISLFLLLWKIPIEASRTSEHFLKLEHLAASVKLFRETILELDTWALAARNGEAGTQFVWKL